MQPLALHRRASLRAGAPSRVRALRAPAGAALDRDRRSGCKRDYAVAVGRCCVKQPVSTNCSDTKLVTLPLHAHQPGDPLAPAALAAIARFHPHPRTAVTAVVLLIDRADPPPPAPGPDGCAPPPAAGARHRSWPAIPPNPRHINATGKQAFSVSMKANLTRSPWRRRRSLFLGFRAPCADPDCRAVTAPAARAIAPLRLPRLPTNRTASAWYSAENLRRWPLPPLSMIHSCRTFVLLGVSTQPGQVQSGAAAGRLIRPESIASLSIKW